MTKKITLPRSPPYRERGLIFKCLSWTSCKETIVSQLINTQEKSFYIFVQYEDIAPYTNDDIQTIEEYLNHKCKKLGFQNVKISEIQDTFKYHYMNSKGKIFYVEIDKRWVRNSVLGTMFMTFLRRKFYIQKHVPAYQDEQHLRDAKWLVRKLYDGDKKLLLSGSKAHMYDWGFVTLGRGMPRGRSFARYDNICKQYTLAQANKGLFRKGLLRKNKRTKV
jgi:hypothetical protein